MGQAKQKSRRKKKQLRPRKRGAKAALERRHCGWKAVGERVNESGLCCHQRGGGERCRGAVWLPLNGIFINAIPKI